MRIFETRKLKLCIRPTTDSGGYSLGICACVSRLICIRTAGDRAGLPLLHSDTGPLATVSLNLHLLRHLRRVQYAPTLVRATALEVRHDGARRWLLVRSGWMRPRAWSVDPHIQLLWISDRRRLGHKRYVGRRRWVLKRGEKQEKGGRAVIRKENEEARRKRREEATAGWLFCVRAKMLCQLK